MNPETGEITIHQKNTFSEKDWYCPNLDTDPKTGKTTAIWNKVKNYEK